MRSYYDTMESLWIPVITCMAFSLGVTAQNIPVPDAAVKAFQQKFPNAASVKWGKEGKNEYEAEFTLEGKKGSANFSAVGEWLETETGIALATIPKTVADGFRTSFPGAVITAAYRIESKKEKNHYEIEYSLKGKKKEARLSPEGKLL